MSPYPASRRGGVCTGSLWKSHSRDGHFSPEPSSSAASTPGSKKDDAASTVESYLAEANAKERTHEFCVLVGNSLSSYSDVWAYAKGDPPTVSFSSSSSIAALPFFAVVISGGWGGRNLRVVGGTYISGWAGVRGG